MRNNEAQMRKKREKIMHQCGLFVFFILHFPPLIRVGIKTRHIYMIFFYFMTIWDSKSPENTWNAFKVYAPNGSIDHFNNIFFTLKIKLIIFPVKMEKLCKWKKWQMKQYFDIKSERMTKKNCKKIKLNQIWIKIKRKYLIKMRKNDFCLLICIMKTYFIFNRIFLFSPRTSSKGKYCLRIPDLLTSYWGVLCVTAKNKLANEINWPNLSVDCMPT